MLPSEEDLHLDGDLPLTSGRIPLDIPDDTQVPPWAYLDVTVRAMFVDVRVLSPKAEQKDDHFNPTAARALAGVYRSDCLHCMVFDCPPAEDPNASDSPVSTGMSSGSDDPPAPTPSATGSAGLIVGGK